MLPQHRPGRVTTILLALGLVLVIGVGAFVATAQTPAPEENLPLAPVPPTVEQPTATAAVAQAAEAVAAEAAAGTPTAQAAATVAPRAAPTAPATPGVAESEFEHVLHPFLLEAKRRRAAAAAQDPNYWNRLDPKLNSTRLNFLLFGYGETHEPPLTERAFIGSITIFSYDYATKEIDLVSLTHDIRAPEAERLLQDQGQTHVGPIKLDRVYDTGGFPLLRQTIEDASGLAIDFQLAFKESVIQGATDNVFGGLDVDVPLPFQVNGFYLDDVKYPPGEFQAGVQHLDGIQVIQFIKTVPVEQNYDPRLEHNARKHLVFKSIMDALAQHQGDVAFMGRAALFFNNQVSQDALAYDFDLKTLLVDNLRGMMTDFRRSDAADQQMPSVQRTMYVVDPASGDGGVQWVNANAPDNPATKRDLDQGVYGETAMEVPYHGDPYAPDLASGYWTDVRQLIASRLAD